ncbi:sulfatase-like hydrolase/transferase [Salinisphaera sp. SPP-AMP-43]
MNTKWIAPLTFGLALLYLLAGFAVAEKIIGEPGSPDALGVIYGQQLPPPDAPSVLVIITGDAGFAVPSAFGGVIPTSTLDRLAENGLCYTRMFSTALCSPTHTVLITGRNHHSAGFGVISEQATGFSGYENFIPNDKAGEEGRPPVGIPYVIVNGKIAFRHGKVLAINAGQPIRYATVAKGRFRPVDVNQWLDGHAIKTPGVSSFDDSGATQVIEKE